MSPHRERRYSTHKVKSIDCYVCPPTRFESSKMKPCKNSRSCPLHWVTSGYIVHQPWSQSRNLRCHKGLSITVVHDELSDCMEAIFERLRRLVMSRQSTAVTTSRYGRSEEGMFW